MSDMNPQALRHMWQRVILQALRDALAVSTIKDMNARAVREDARAWLEGGSKDFEHVCTLAGFDAAVVREWWATVKDDEQKFDAAGRFLRDAAARKEARDAKGDDDAE